MRSSKCEGEGERERERERERAKVAQEGEGFWFFVHISLVAQIVTVCVEEKKVLKKDAVSYLKTKCYP